MDFLNVVEQPEESVLSQSHQEIPTSFRFLFSFFQSLFFSVDIGVVPVLHHIAIKSLQRTNGNFKEKYK
jgi:hypothetical protein